MVIGYLFLFFIITLKAVNEMVNDIEFYGRNLK